MIWVPRLSVIVKPSGCAMSRYLENLSELGIILVVARQSIPFWVNNNHIDSHCLLHLFHIYNLVYFYKMMRNTVKFIIQSCNEDP